MADHADIQTDRSEERDDMVQRQIAARGVRDDRVLGAMRSVPREHFVAERAVEFAYADSALAIGEDQTISQPYIVALMVEALGIEPQDRVLEVGAGSGYAAAVLSHLAARVFAVERHEPLVEDARRALDRVGIQNVTLRHGDGTRGWPDEAPFDAILVSAGGVEVPDALVEQLAPGGTLVIPVGAADQVQHLKRIQKDASTGEIRSTDLGAVRFVPLIGSVAPPRGKEGHDRPEASADEDELDPALRLIREHADPLGPDAGDPDPDALERMADRATGHRTVLIGEASHGTSEFYRLRERLTRRLIERGEVDFVAVEADWPDAAHLDRWVRGVEPSKAPFEPFTRFPTWMWANEETLDFLRWLRDFNESIEDPDDRVGFFGLDLYSLHSSIRAVLDYLDDVDPDTAELARERFGCLTPWERNPQTYGQLAATGRMEDCEDEVVEILTDLLEKRIEYERSDGRNFMDALENARTVANAERYYRAIYQGPTASWNLRDRHMMDTLLDLLGYHGPDSTAVVWAHNSHLGDASATELSAGGQFNLGQLCGERFGEGCRKIGLGTHSGAVMAASAWDEPGEIKRVRPSLEGSWERLSHEADMPNFALPLDRHEPIRRAFAPERLERAIGVIYRPQTERQSHYFHASLSRQFDEWVFLDETSAVTPLERGTSKEAGDMEMPETFPFAV